MCNSLSNVTLVILLIAQAIHFSKYTIFAFQDLIFHASIERILCLYTKMNSSAVRSLDSYIDGGYSTVFPPRCYPQPWRQLPVGDKMDSFITVKPPHLVNVVFYPYFRMGVDYTLSRIRLARSSYATDTRLVSEPSPYPAIAGVGAWLRIAQSSSLLPYPRSFSAARVCFHITPW